MMMPVVMTPHVSTPAVFQQSAPQWVTQTPESSPMLWGCAPINEAYMMQPEMSMGKGVSKEFLRAVCEPFFDQMLVAVQQALQAQSQQSCQMPAPCWQQPMMRPQGPARPYGSDEPSTE